MCFSIAFISSTLYDIWAKYNNVDKRFDPTVLFLEEGDLGKLPLFSSRCCCAKTSKSLRSSVEISHCVISAVNTIISTSELMEDTRRLYRSNKVFDHDDRWMESIQNHDRSLGQSFGGICATSEQ